MGESCESAIDAARRDAVRSFIEGHADEFVAQLSEWLRIPSVSTDPERADDVRRSAQWLAEALRETGFPTVEIWPAGGADGAPAVFAEWHSDDPHANTVLVYGHHDVQPVDPIELWSFAPFEPAVVDGPDGDKLLGRGASDDKGQVLYHLLGLRASLAASGKRSPAVNLKILVEGEEESGSPRFPDLLRENRERLTCDVVVVSDTGMYGAGVTTVCVGMRGLTDCQIDLRGPGVDLHSGSFGGAVPNPLTALARLLAGLHDNDGRITLKGFYDRVIPLTERAWSPTSSPSTSRLLFARTLKETCPRALPRTCISSAPACGPLWCRSTIRTCRRSREPSGERSTTRCSSPARADQGLRLISPKSSRFRWCFWASDCPPIAFTRLMSMP